MEKVNVRWGWLKFMYIFTFVVAGGMGLGIISLPMEIKRLFTVPEVDPVTFGITGSVYLAFGLVAILGLKSPLKFIPILLLQLIYKLVWFFGVVLPLIIQGNFPHYAIPIVILWTIFVLGDFIAIPFRYIFSSQNTIE